MGIRSFLWLESVPRMYKYIVYIDPAKSSAVAVDLFYNISREGR